MSDKPHQNIENSKQNKSKRFFEITTNYLT